MEHFIIHKGTPIFYSTTGYGSPIVLLHGFLETKEIWNETIGKLKQYRQVVTIDLPGHGKSGNFNKVHTMEDMAEAVHVVLQKLSLPKIALVGHSMGGYVALAYLEKYPNAVEEIILLNSTPEPDSTEKRKLRERSVNMVNKKKKAFIQMAISGLTSPKNLELFKHPIEELKENAYKLSKASIIAALQGMKVRKDRKEVLKNFKGGKLLVTGEDDPLLNKSEIERLAHYCECRLSVIPGGHLSYIESKYNFWELCISSKK